MPSFRLSRRAVLKGAGGLAIALPWLEIMSRERRARAADPAKRFLAVYTPGGTTLADWRPTGSETSFTLSRILTPLAPVQSRIIVADGLDMKSAIGDERAAGIVAWLTGTPQDTRADQGLIYATGPSIDQVIASTAAQGPKRIPSLSFAVRWAAGKSHGLASPWNIANFSVLPGFAPVPPRIDPVAIWNELFQMAPGGGDWRRSMLDFVDRRYVALGQRLGAADKRRLDEHLTNLRALEQRTQGCASPTLVDTADYDPHAGVAQDDLGNPHNVTTDAAIPKVGKLMMDMLVMAMACDITAVGTMQWSDAESKYTLPWLGLPENQAFYENDGGYHPAEMTTIGTWYASQHAYLLQQMARTDMGGHSLLDESVVFFGSEMQNPSNYLKTDMPFLLAGGGGGLRTGRWINFGSQPHNNLLVSILNLFGDPRTTFGNPRYCTGPTGRLT